MNAVALVPTVGPVTAMVSVHGIPLIRRAVHGLLNAGCVRHVVVSAQPSDVDLITSVLAGEPVTIIAGDVHDCLHAATDKIPDACFALVHDASRAATPPEVFQAVVTALEGGAKAVIPILPLPDTVKLVDETGRITGTRDRDGLRVLQSPLGVQVDVLRAAGPGPLLESLGVPIDTVPGHPHGLRIRTPLDVATVSP